MTRTQETPIWASKRVWHNLILFVIFVYVRLTGVAVPEETQTAVVTNFDILFNAFVFLWNFVIKVVDTSTEKRGELNLSWWNIFGIGRELLRVVGVVRG